MEYTTLGNTDIKVSKICLGCMSFGEAGTLHDWTLDEKQTEEMVKHALDLGINFFDTSNNYSKGTSEEYLGKAFKNLGVKREDIVIASKVYFNEGRLSKEAIFREIEGTLKRLGTDYLEDNFLKEVYEYLGDCDLFKYDFSLLGSELKKEKTNNINEVVGYKALKELISLNDNFEKLNKYIIKRKLLTDNKVVINKDDFYSNLTIVPYLLTISEKFNNSNLTGYVYRTENNSFRKSFLDTPRKMAYDVLSKYEYLESLNFTAIYSEEQKSTLLDYISKKVMYELKNLKGKEKKEFKKIIKNKKIKNNIKKESFFKKLLGR